MSKPDSKRTEIGRVSWNNLLLTHWLPTPGKSVILKTETLKDNGALMLRNLSDNMLKILDYPDNTEAVYEVCIFWDKFNNKFFLRYLLERKSSSREERLDEISFDEAQVEVINHRDQIEEDSAIAAGLKLPATKIKAYTNYEFVGEGKGDDGLNFHWYSVVEIEKNSESPFYFHSPSHDTDARKFILSILPELVNNKSPVSA